MTEPLSFFLPMVPPTTTAQTRAVTIRSGKPRFYEPPALADAKAKLAAHTNIRLSGI